MNGHYVSVISGGGFTRRLTRFTVIVGCWYSTFYSVVTYYCTVVLYSVQHEYRATGIIWVRTMCLSRRHMLHIKRYWNSLMKGHFTCSTSYYYLSIGDMKKCL